MSNDNGSGRIKLDAAMHQSSLDGMLEALFRPFQENGFWSEDEGRIVRSLNYTVSDSGEFQWSPNLEERLRYGPMALMGIAMWRMSSLGTEKYDEKLLRNLSYFQQFLKDPKKLQALPSYGAGPLIYAFSRLHDLWPNEGLDETAESLIDFSVGQYQSLFNEDSLVLMGMAARFDRLTPEQRSSMQRLAESLRSIQDAKGLYRTKEHRGAFKHQNQMYTIWGLGHADMALGQDLSAKGIQRCLQYTIDHRMQSDGALLWHNYRDLLHRLHSGFHSVFLGRMPERKRLFSCHQAFFIYAVQVYRALSRDDSAFAEAHDNALRWEYGQNAIGENLFTKNGLGVPVRIMFTSGELDSPSDRFVGIYEIGAMIMCMVKLLDKPSAVAAS